MSHVRHLNHASRARSFNAHPSHGNQRIKVVIRIDRTEESARVEVRGVVTTDNIRAVYVVCRRVAIKLAGYELVVDLAHARVTAAALEEVREHARRAIVSSGIDTSVTPCRLRIVDPQVILRTKELA
ncbi:hypothetical protein [Arthrobacter sp. UYEF3]|uniref:hypothetical protein n=1 Tax=Arthrobacter sp. UYEF3 TaxID=1756365 RepID=UPI0033933E57